MSKDELKEIGAYKNWRFNFIFLVVFAAVWIAIGLFLSLYLFLSTQDAKFFYILLVIGGLVLAVCGPFIVYLGVQMIKLRKNAGDYKKVKVSITYADKSYFSNREGGVYDCTAYYRDADATVYFKVYMRYLSNGIDLDQGKIVEVWYNEKDGKAFFANKIKSN